MNVDHIREPEERCSPLASALLTWYRLTSSESLRAFLRRRIVALEGGPGCSRTIRRIFKTYQGVEIGFFSTGSVEGRPGLLHRGTVIGRYCTISPTVRTFTRHHPRNTKSTHGLFYNPGLGWVPGDPIQFGRLVIGHGASVGHGAIFLHPAELIGEGAIVKPGAVVYSNVPPYAIVVGNPARVTGYRFSPEQIKHLQASEWWKLRPGELAPGSGRVRHLIQTIPAARAETMASPAHGA
jgi:virginiamycin A acetyltransferase